MRTLGCWRKLCVLLTAMILAVTLAACNGPSKKNAEALALQVTTALYGGDIQPMLDNLDYSVFAAESSDMQYHEIETIKVNLRSHVNWAEQFGGLDSVVVAKEVKLNVDDTYDVCMQVKFKREISFEYKLSLRWDAEIKKLVIFPKNL